MRSPLMLVVGDSIVLICVFSRADAKLERSGVDVVCGNWGLDGVRMEGNA